MRADGLLALAREVYVSRFLQAKVLKRLRGGFKKEFGTFDSYLWTNLYRLITNVSNEKSNEIKL